MTSVADLLVDAFGRIRESVHSTLGAPGGSDEPDGLTADELAYRPDPDANSIAWLVWHLTRVQDDHIAEVAGLEQVWTAAGWSSRFGLPFAVDEIGYGQSSADVAQVRPDSSELLLGYHDAVFEQTVAYVRGLTDADLDRIVDERWDPPVTLAVRLISVVNDDLQHVGQAAYLAGLVHRR